MENSHENPERTAKVLLKSTETTACTGLGVDYTSLEYGQYQNLYLVAGDDAPDFTISRVN